MFQFLLKMNSKRNVRKFSLLMFVLVCASASGVAQYLVTGKITSGEDQSPLPGVNILVKGRTLWDWIQSQSQYKDKTTMIVAVYNSPGNNSRATIASESNCQNAWCSY